MMTAESREATGLSPQAAQEKDGIVIVKVEEEDEEEHMWGQDASLQESPPPDPEVFRQRFRLLSSSMTITYLHIKSSIH